MPGRTLARLAQEAVRDLSRLPSASCPFCSGPEEPVGLCQVLEQNFPHLWWSNRSPEVYWESVWVTRSLKRYAPSVSTVVVVLRQRRRARNLAEAYGHKQRRTVFKICVTSITRCVSFPGRPGSFLRSETDALPADCNCGRTKLATFAHCAGRRCSPKKRPRSEDGPAHRKNVGPVCPPQDLPRALALEQTTNAPNARVRSSKRIQII